MRLHNMISNSENNTSTSSWYAVGSNHKIGDQNITMEISSACVKRCVGDSSAAKCSHCGNDQSCWDSCAGGGSGSCIASCYTSANAY